MSRDASGFGGASSMRLRFSSDWQRFAGLFASPLAQVLVEGSAELCRYSQLASLTSQPVASEFSLLVLCLTGKTYGQSLFLCVLRFIQYPTVTFDTYLVLKRITPRFDRDSRKYSRAARRALVTAHALNILDPDSREYSRRASVIVLNIPKSFRALSKFSRLMWWRGVCKQGNPDKITAKRLRTRKFYDVTRLHTLFSN